jgi:hypothetical protein
VWELELLTIHILEMPHKVVMGWNVADLMTQVGTIHHYQRKCDFGELLGKDTFRLAYVILLF